MADEKDQYKRMKGSLFFKDIKARLERLLASIKSVPKKGLSELPTGARQFQASEQEIRGFLTYFIEQAVPNEELQGKLKTSLENGWRVEEHKQPLQSGRDLGEASFTQGSCGYDEKTKTLSKMIVLGEKDPKTGKHKTSLKTTRIWLHELTHSVSQRYSEQYIAEHGESVKDMALGEIESAFMEKVYVEYIRTHTQQMADAGKIPGLDEINYNNEMVKMHADDIRAAVRLYENGAKGKQSKEMQSFERLYVAGEVVSELLLADYKENPKATMARFNEYMSKNAEMTLDEGINFLTAGKSKTYDAAVENYIKHNKGISDRNKADAAEK